MSELTDKLRGACIDWDGTEEKYLAEPVHFVSCGDLRAAADALEAQEARLASMSKALTRLIDAADDLGNATNCGLADDAIAEARSALTPSLPK